MIQLGYSQKIIINKRMTILPIDVLECVLVLSIFTEDVSKMVVTLAEVVLLRIPDFVLEDCIVDVDIVLLLEDGLVDVDIVLLENK